MSNILTPPGINAGIPPTKSFRRENPDQWVDMWEINRQKVTDPYKILTIVKKACRVETGTETPSGPAEEITETRQNQMHYHIEYAITIYTYKRNWLNVLGATLFVVGIAAAAVATGGALGVAGFGTFIGVSGTTYAAIGGGLVIAGIGGVTWYGTEGYERAEFVGYATATEDTFLEDDGAPYPVITQKCN
jgi:hypothetical protein